MSSTQDLPHTHGRRETPTERQDRLWADILQELRVMQTGAQLTSGFLLTLPFQSAFQDLSRTDKVIYLVLVGLSLLITAMVITAVAVHQRLSGRHLKERVVASGRTVVRIVVYLLALLIIGIAVFTFDIVVGPTAATVVGCIGAVLLVVLLVAVPHLLVRVGPNGNGNGTEA